VAFRGRLLVYPAAPTRETFSTVDIDDLLEAAVESLWVCRADSLYFVDLVDSQLPDVDSMDSVLPLTNQSLVAQTRGCQLAPHSVS